MHISGVCAAGSARTETLIGIWVCENLSGNCNCKLKHWQSVKKKMLSFVFWKVWFLAQNRQAYVIGQLILGYPLLYNAFLLLSCSFCYTLIGISPLIQRFPFAVPDLLLPLEWGGWGSFETTAVSLVALRQNGQRNVNIKSCIPYSITSLRCLEPCNV